MRKIWMPIAAILLSVALLLSVYYATVGVREANADKELQEKMATLLPGSSSFEKEDYTGDDANIAFVYRGDNGYVIGTVTQGYAGPIHMLVGVCDDGYVTGLQVRQMQETPTLGAEALSDWEFLSQFLNTAGDADVGTNVDALTGATVTSKAIARSVNSAVAFVTGADIDSGATAWGGK